MPGCVANFGYGKKKRQPEKLPLFVNYLLSVIYLLYLVVSFQCLIFP